MKNQWDFDKQYQYLMHEHRDNLEGSLEDAFSSQTNPLQTGYQLVE